MWIGSLLLEFRAFFLVARFTMAEYVHQNLEGMFPELEEIERMGVLLSEDIR